MSKSLFSAAKMFLLVALLTFGVIYVQATWNEPTATPPGDNTAAPVNVGTTDQVKSAGLGVDSLAVFGNAILSGIGRYLNFGTNAGETGYGFRDNAGVIEYKDDGGTWTALNVGGGSEGGVSMIVCEGQSGSVGSGWHTYNFSAAQCGGSLPDSTYVGTVSRASGNCGNVDTVTVNSATPGVTSWCSATGYRAYKIVYLKENGSVAGTGAPDFESGWVTISRNATGEVAHNLGTDEFSNFQIVVRQNATNNDETVINSMHAGVSSYYYDTTYYPKGLMFFIDKSDNPSDKVKWFTPGNAGFDAVYRTPFSQSGMNWSTYSLATGSETFEVKIRIWK